MKEAGVDPDAAVGHMDGSELDASLLNPDRNFAIAAGKSGIFDAQPTLKAAFV
jgi:hypothetical protein